jgi:precorrin-2 dehydrogenase / sirohydrochlorin ferrochelatase
MGRFGYPVSLDLVGRTAVVIGREALAQGKDRALEAAGATLVVRSEDEWTPADLDGAFLCVAASHDPVVRDAVYRAARERGVLVNVMDDVPRCDFAAPAVVRRGDLTIAVSTGGRSPALARRLRERLEARFGPEWAEALEVLGEVRDETLPCLPDLADRSRRWAEALDLEELASLVRTGRRDEARDRLRARLLAGMEEASA